MHEPQAGGERTTLVEAVVLDANVLYPMALRDLLLRLAEQGFFLPRWSAQILDEVRRNLVADGRSDEARITRLLGEIRRHFLNAEVNPSEELVERMTNAAEDRHVLATAVAAGADLIVTLNLRDFPPSAVDPLGIVVLSPDAFLGDLLEVAPETILEILMQQAADLINPPMTLGDVLLELAIQTPSFAARVREMAS